MIMIELNNFYNKFFSYIDKYQKYYMIIYQKIFYLL